MKINIVSHSFIGTSTGYYNMPKKCLVGGGEVYLYDFAKFLIKEGHDVTIIQAGDTNENFEYEGIKIKQFRPWLRLKGPIGIIERYGIFNLQWKSHIDKDAEHIHLHDFMHGFPWANNTMTGTCHGITWDNPYYVSNIQLWLYRLFIRPIAKYSVKHLKKIIANDTFFLKFVQSEMPQHRDKIEVIFNYVNTEIFNPKQQRVFEGFRFIGKSLIFYPRNFGYGRGGINSVKAMKIVAEKYPDVVLIMAGDGPEKKYCEKYVTQNKLESNVVFIGHIDHFKQMPEWFAECNITIIPSVSTEGTSLSCLEAMATKKPVIVTNIGGLPDIVIDEFNGLICKPNPESLANNIIKYLDNPELMEKMAKTGYKWVSKRHNYKLWCQKYKKALFG